MVCAYFVLIYAIISQPLLLRLLGGALDEEYQRMRPLRRRLFESTALATDILFFETKHLTSYFKKHGAKRAEWYPNCRGIADIQTVLNNTRNQCKRFVFLGRVTRDKGIEVILQAIPYLSNEAQIDIFGPLDGHYTAEYLSYHGKEVVRYRGVLSPEEVYQRLFEYDALILPTYYEGEGYPGVILEAYSHGLPVIATRWRSIPETVDNDTGILIPTHSPEALAEAINQLCRNPALYQSLCQGVLRKRIEFSEEAWADRFVRFCMEVAGRCITHQ